MELGVRELCTYVQETSMPPYLTTAPTYSVVVYVVVFFTPQLEYTFYIKTTAAVQSTDVLVSYEDGVTV